MQLIQLIGRLGNDAMEKSKDGRTYVEFSIACDVKRGDTKYTQWYNIYYTKNGVFEYLKKGTQVYVLGRPSFSIYEPNNGGERSVSISVSASIVELCGSGSAGLGDK